MADERVVEGSEAVALAVKGCRPHVISAFPISPQTHIVETLARMVANGEVDAEYIPVGKYSQAGHDFWLTRNGHGAGFWDGDWPDRTGHRLSEAAKSYGEYHLYVGDDGKIYGM